MSAHNLDQHDQEFDRIDDRLSEAILDLRCDKNLELPVSVHRDLDELEQAMTRVRYWLRDQIQLAAHLRAQNAEAPDDYAR